MSPSDQEKIDAAVKAHGMWLARLRRAIEDKKSEFDPAIVKTDSNCEFGKWLYGSFPASLRGTPVFEEIRALHARFHAHAGRILEAALSGKTADALRFMDSSGEFMQLSGTLVLKLKALRNT